MSDDITFCLCESCKNCKCERHSSNITQHWRDHSFASFDECEYWKEGEKE